MLTVYLCVIFACYTAVGLLFLLRLTAQIRAGSEAVLPDNIPGRCFHTHEAEYIQDLNLKSVGIDQLPLAVNIH